ncbi:hypothetical protein [Salinispira pacifica]|uniref:hypothetical protein n=1 Tax=Salinispira pacifica TaxID=1307761 RepID=UPI00059E125C|nr:hypothetical protein [Salinispira pacifica]
MTDIAQRDWKDSEVRGSGTQLSVHITGTTGFDENKSLKSRPNAGYVAEGRKARSAQLPWKAAAHNPHSVEVWSQGWSAAVATCSPMQPGKAIVPYSLRLLFSSLISQFADNFEVHNSKFKLTSSLCGRLQLNSGIMQGN